MTPAELAARDLNGWRGIALPAELPAMLAASALIALIAAAARLWGLDAVALDPPEAGVAALAMGLPGVSPSALLVSLEKVALLLLGPNPAAARLVPVLAGIAMATLTVGLWRVLGRAAAVGAGALVALGPAWVFYGRHVSSEGVAAAAVVGLLAASIAPPRHRRWAVPLAVACLATAGPPAFTFALVALMGVGGARENRRAVAAWLEAGWPDARSRWSALALGGVVFVVVATAALTRPAGLVDVMRTPVAWLERFGGGGSPTDLVLAWLTLGLPETVLGLCGLALLVRRRMTIGGFAALWIGFAFFVVVVGGAASSLAEVLLPLALVAGVALAALLGAWAASPTRAGEAAGAGALLVVFLFALMQLAVFAHSPPPAADALAIALGAVALVPLLTLLGAIVSSPGSALRSLGLALVVGLALWSWGAGAGIARGSPFWVREVMRPWFATPDVERLAHDVAGLEAGGDDVRLHPALASSLSLRFAGAPVAWGDPGEGDEAYVVAPLGVAPSGFAPVARYWPTARWRREFPSPASAPPLSESADPHPSARGFARWALLREAADGTRDGDIELEAVELLRRES